LQIKNAKEEKLKKMWIQTRNVHRSSRTVYSLDHVY